MAGAGWPELPPEILFSISERISDISDIHRFRSVCVSWRSCCPPPTPRLPIFSNYELSIFRNLNSTSSHCTAVHTRTLYLIKSPLDHRRSWLIKTDNHAAAPALSDGLMKLYCPLSSERRHYLGNKVLDFSKFQVIELRHEYVSVLTNYRDDLLEIYQPVPLKFVVREPRRVAFIRTGDDNRFVFFAEYFSGILKFIRSGDTHWTIVFRDENTVYSYICNAAGLASFEGRVYVVDVVGRTCVVDQFGNVTCFIDCAPPDLLTSQKVSRFLVESEGELLLVDVGFRSSQSPEPFQFGMFKLNVERSEWDRVQLELGDQVVFLGEVGSFSISASQLGWSRGNFIFSRISSKLYVYDVEEDEVTSLDRNDYDPDHHHLNLLSPPLEWFPEQSHKSSSSSSSNNKFMRMTPCARVLGQTSVFITTCCFCFVLLAVTAIKVLRTYLQMK